MSVRRQVRFYSVDANEKVGEDQWHEIKFHDLALLVDKASAPSSPNQVRYHFTKNERWFIEFHKMDAKETSGRLVRSRLEGVPHSERDYKLSKLKLAKGEGVADVNHFAVFNDNTLAYEQNRSGLRAGEFAACIESIARGQGPYVVIQFNQLVLESFKTILPRIMSLTKLRMRPVVRALPKLEERSKLDVFRLLRKSAEGAKMAELCLSAGKRPLPKESFAADLAQFLKEYLTEEGNLDDFDILAMSAVLDTGEIRPLDMSDRHMVQRTARFNLDRDRTIDSEDALDRIRAAYHEKKDLLEKGRVYALGPDYEQVRL